MKRSYEMDLCSGPLLSKILLFSLPLSLSGVLQLLFNGLELSHGWRVPLSMGWRGPAPDIQKPLHNGCATAV